MDRAFRRQYRLLVTLGQAYDAGDEDAAYPLSVALRVLLHAGLLDRVLKLKRLHLRDTATRVPGPPYGLGYGLTRFTVLTGPSGSSVPERAKIRPALDDTEAVSNPDVIFRDWWNRDLSVLTFERGHTRSYVVLEMANTDAAHVDHNQDEEYLKLFSPDATLKIDGNNTEGSVATASVRQVAWEVEQTLLVQYPDLVRPD
jgi:hypothetical protein